MLVIRLVRVGRRNLAHYRMVVSEKRSKLRGKVVDHLGSYNPHRKTLLGVSKEKVEEWVKRGAQVSNSVARLLNKEFAFNFQLVEKKRPKKKPKEEVAPEVPVSKREEGQDKAEVKEEPKLEEAPAENEKREEPSADLDPVPPGTSEAQAEEEQAPEETEDKPTPPVEGQE